MEYRLVGSSSRGGSSHYQRWTLWTWYHLLAAGLGTASEESRFMYIVASKQSSSALCVNLNVYVCQLEPMNSVSVMLNT